MREKSKWHEGSEKQSNKQVAKQESESREGKQQIKAAASSLGRKPTA
jgi:hypothetical protein